MAQSHDKTDDKKRLPRKDLPPDAHIETLAVREGLPPTQWGENSEALFLTSSFVHPDAETAARRFANEEEAFVYSRFSNPTVTMMERRLAALEGTEACIGTASGMAAITMIILGLLKAGDHVVYSRSMFGSSLKLIGSEFARFGVESTAVPQTEHPAYRQIGLIGTGRVARAPHSAASSDCWMTRAARCWAATEAVAEGVPASAGPETASTAAEPPSAAAASKPVLRTVITLIAAEDCTVAMALPA